MPLALAVRRQDQIGDFAHGPLAAFLLADVVDGFEDVGHGIGWRGRKPDGAVRELADLILAAHGKG